MAISPGFRDRLSGITCAKRVLTDPADTWVYGYDNSRKHAPPDVVVFVTSQREVQDIVRLCYENAVPIVARGRGTATTGAAIPLRGGVVLSLERMNRILNVDPANRAVNAAGPHAVKYGSTRENTLGLRAVTGTGDDIHTGVYTTKGVVGYDLTRLLIGSEGTLAVITEATLKLTPLPEARRLMQAVYTNVAQAAAAISRIMAQPATPCALEFMDAAAIDMIRGYSQAELPQGAGALLLIEVDGPASAINSMTAAIRTAATDAGLVSFHEARTQAETDALWATRKALSPALRTIAPNKLNEDVVVPVSRLPELINGLGELSRAHGIPIVNFGHAGNGNIHVNLLYDSQDPQQEANARPCLHKVFDLVIRLGGTLSGEHGIGREKRDYIALAIDPPTLDLMRRIKAQFDPKGILNPDKIFPPTPQELPA
jgi:D-lactate dehydrogenase